MVRRKRGLLWGRAGGREGGSEKVDSEFVTKLAICGNFWYIHILSEIRGSRKDETAVRICYIRRSSALGAWRL